VARSHWSDSDDPRRLQRGLFGSITIWVIALCLLFGAVGIVGWQVGWWLKSENVNRQVAIDNNNTGVQTAWHDEAMKTISDYELVDPANTAARGALENKACDLIGRLNDDYRNIQINTFERENCQ
jgi:hypothetical protein